YIARALHTCINQTFKDIEIIVVDDCGEDKSIDIAKEYAKQDSRIKIIHNHENLKLLRARYEGVKAASSPYIMFLDPDDYLELDACETCIKILNDEDELDFIWFDFIYDTGKNLKKDNFLEDKYLSIVEYCEYILTQKDISYWNLCSKIIKTDVYKKAFLCIENLNIKLNMAEDALIYFFIVLNSKIVATSSKFIYFYFKNSQSYVNTNDILKIEESLDDEKKVIMILSSFLKSNRCLNKHIIAFLKIMIIQLKINKLSREVKQYKLKYCYILYKYKKIINSICSKYYFINKFFITKHIL
ncbi:glycosyltransferase family 2 protein, partial [Campylobacter hepaticus]